MLYLDFSDEDNISLKEEATIGKLCWSCETEMSVERTFTELPSYLMFKVDPTKHVHVPMHLNDYHLLAVICQFPISGVFYCYTRRDVTKPKEE